MWAYLALAAVQVVGGFQQADIIRQNGKLQGDMADMNARFAEVDAYNAREAGYSNAAKYETQIDQTVGAVKGAYAGANVDVKYGTASDVQTDNRVAGFENVLQLRRQAENAALGYQTQAINMRLGGQMTQLNAGLQAASAQASGLMQGIQTSVTGYAFGQSTGKGSTSRTGTDAKPVFDKSLSMHVNDTGDGVRAPATMDAPRPYFNGNDQFQRGPGELDYHRTDGWRDMNAPGNSYYAYGKSFTDETG